ncbi:response regulator [Undibacterium parvum]|uniref:Response regulator n=1 Tax=Undibacterium parvum TaxID=401471 RepID=A0A3Q9BSN2_9BURK|nr:response regulator [Undibacterium parvum]AZP13592.1 response regulator [Undibacterium parvum]
MNTNLSFLTNLGVQIQEFLSLYLFAISLCILLGAALFIFFIGRSKNSEALDLLAPESAQTKGIDTAGLAALDQRVAILVVDDSAVARAKLAKLLENAGYRVGLAKDGLEAMEKLNLEFFSVLLTDLEMPNMNGLELIAAVQGSMDTEDIPIIAITGHDELQARVHDYQGLFGIFKKPWNDRELLKRVATLSVLRQKK